MPSWLQMIDEIKEMEAMSKAKEKEVLEFK